METSPHLSVRILGLLGLVLLLGPGPSLAEDCHDYSQDMHFVDYLRDANGVFDLVLQGPYAMTVGGDGSFVVYDVSTPTAATRVAELPLEYYRIGLAVDGALAGAIALYYAEDFYDHAALQLIDVSNPLQPVFRGQLPLDTIPNGIAITGNHVYLTSVGLLVVDASDPGNPSLVGGLAFSNATCITIANGYAYVVDAVDYERNVLHVVDLANAASPQSVGSIELDWDCRDISLDGTLLYVGGRKQGTIGGLLVVDVSDPQAPELIGTTELPPYVLSVGAADGVAIVQCRLLHGIDVSDPSAPRPVGATENIDSSERTILRDGYAFMATGSLQIYDVAHPSTADFVHTAAVSIHPDDMVVLGTLAYALDPVDGLVVLDVSDPLEPVRLAQESLPVSPTRKQLWLSGGLAFVSGGGLYIVDLSDPMDPRLRGSVVIQTPPVTYRVVAVGNYAYLSTSDGLQTYDVSDPDHPVLRHTLILGDFSSYMDYDGNGHIAIGCSEFPELESWLRVLDLSDPAHPVEIGAAAIPFGHHMVEIHDGIVYVSSSDYSDSYLSAVDITVPAEPVLLGTEHFPNYLDDFLIVDAVGYGAAPYCGLTVFDLTDPTDPRLLSNIPVESEAVSHTVVALGDYICLGADGLHYALPHCGAAQVAEEERPRLPSVPGLAVRPNPLAPCTSIDFDLSCSQHVRVAVYDLVGRHVATLAERAFGPGAHSLIWDGTDLFGHRMAAGCYVIRLEGERERRSRRVFLVE